MDEVGLHGSLLNRLSVHVHRVEWVLFCYVALFCSAVNTFLSAEVSAVSP